MRGGWPSFGREENGESLGQLGGASLSNCRELRVEGESTPKLGATSQKTPLRVKLEFVSQGTNANEGGRGGFSGLPSKQSSWVSCRYSNDRQ
jgi:hypothetical protein